MNESEQLIRKRMSKCHAALRADREVTRSDAEHVRKASSGLLLCHGFPLGSRPSPAHASSTLILAQPVRAPEASSAESHRLHPPGGRGSRQGGGGVVVLRGCASPPPPAHCPRGRTISMGAARGRRGTRSPIGPGAARPSGPLHHDDLHLRPEPRAAGGMQPPSTEKTGRRTKVEGIVSVAVIRLR